MPNMDHTRVYAGARALGLYLLENPSLVAGKSVLDICSGGGIAAQIVKSLGAEKVLANDKEPLATAKLKKTLPVYTGCFSQLKAQEYDVILAGDCWYSEPIAELARSWMINARLVLTSAVERPYPTPTLTYPEFKKRRTYTLGDLGVTEDVQQVITHVFERRR